MKAAKEKTNTEASSAMEVLSFLPTLKIRLIFALGCFGAVVHGMIYPSLAFVFAKSFSKLSSNLMDGVREVAIIFIILGSIAFVSHFVQHTCFEVAAGSASRHFRLTWFQALLRQDAAYFDVYSVSGVASTVAANSVKLKRGLGKKCGEGLQFLVTGVGGIAYAFYSSWRMALVIFGALPIIGACMAFVMKFNQNQTSGSMKAYTQAASVAYQTVSNIRTVFSLNAMKEMIRLYCAATAQAYEICVKPLYKVGLANGSMMASFLCLFVILTLYGTSLLADGIRSIGCDPSDAVPNGVDCTTTGGSVFGAMLGIAFSAQGIAQVANFVEAFSDARAACYPALQAINRTVGSASGEEREVEVHKHESKDSKADEKDDVEEDKSSKKKGSFLSRSKSSSKATETESDEEIATKPMALLPKYEIDSSSEKGSKPQNLEGNISFENVEFSYPTRPNQVILNGLNLQVSKGQTVALVGPSGGGKSTVISILERFYDPKSGKVCIDGIDIKNINIHHLRDQIGLVSQEPTLFATTIAGNICYGKPDATQEEIENAAKLANAHDFIISFPDGYNTQVGDKGAQLSGGQKQRIAIARILVKNPKILLLDEATSALDSESEVVVQEALDKLLVGHQRTTIVIAHRLSTIRNADVIAVISGGKVIEKGSHDELMSAEQGQYRALVERQYGSDVDASAISNRTRSTGDLSGLSNSRASSLLSLESLVDEQEKEISQLEFRNVTFSYPSRASKLVMSGFNLRIRKGETLALVGPSGGGKSTTVSLIERFYDPNQGAVFYEGVDIKELNTTWLRDQIGYVGQEPTLFNDTIANNIAYGYQEATREEIEHAARLANAHDFIMTFPSGYDTPVGDRGTQISGGQKQRIAIARALVKRPKILLFDEATSALDSNSEAVVQEALDALMVSKDRTIIVIAHRLSTIRNADRIAFVGDGKVKEVGSHEELMSLPHSRYRRLIETQNTRISALIKYGEFATDEKTSDEENEDEKKIDTIETEEKWEFNMKELRTLAYVDWKFLLLGIIGCAFAGGVFPAWGVVYGVMLNLLFRPVFPCDDANVLTDFGYNTCQAYWDDTADSMQREAVRITYYWLSIMVASLIGNVLAFKGFGTASQSLNKRLRDMTFKALCRQEVGYFDLRSVGVITSQLQDDVTKIDAFTGQPLREIVTSMCSVLVGFIIAMVHMWPFALLALAYLPLMGFVTMLRSKTMLGEDQGDDHKESKEDAAGIMVETLLNMRTVAALNLEQSRYNDYKAAVDAKDVHYVKNSTKEGLISGMAAGVEQWVNALQFYWGGYLLTKYPNQFNFQDFLVAMFALLLSLFGAGGAKVGAIDKKEATAAAERLFSLIHRRSAIDSMASDGKKLD